MTIMMQRSFAAGEISPYLYARVDQVKYATGLNTCRNMMVLRHGGISSRAGTSFVGEVNDSTKGVSLKKFVFNAQQTYALEFGDGYIRINQNGQQVLEATVAITGITAANPAVITAAAHGFKDGDEVFVTAVVGMRQINGRNLIVQGVTTNTFTVQTKNGVALDSSAFTAYVSGGTVARVYTIASPYASEDISTIEYVQSGDVITLTNNNYPPYQLSRTSATSWSFGLAKFAPTMTAPTAPAVTSTGAGGDSYVVTAISADNGEESLPTTKVTSSATAAPGTILSITWTAAPGAQSYNVYKNLNGVFGFIGSAGLDGVTMSFKDNGITADATTTPPSSLNPFSAAGSTVATSNTMSSTRVDHTATLMNNGKVLVVGKQSVTHDATADIYDPGTKKFTAASNLPTNPIILNHLSAVLLNNGNVLVAGATSGAAAAAWVYNPSLATWTATGAVTVSSGQVNALVLLADGRVLLIGGLVASTNSIYDPVTNTWSATGACVLAHYNIEAILLPSGKVLISGGTNGAIQTECELFDPGTGLFTATGSMATARMGHRMALLRGNKVLVAGGIDATGTTPSATCEIYDIASGTWSATGAMSAARYDHIQIALSGTSILVAGGETVVGTPIKSVELYDQFAGTWSSSQDMTVNRQRGAGCLLPDGTTLLTGGMISGPAISYTSTNTAEAYDPGLDDFPATCSYYQQRFLLANTRKNTEKVFASKIGNFLNFSTSTPIQDDDEVEFVLTGNQVNAVKHMADLGQLIIFTSAGEFSVSGDGNGALTPSSINARQHSYSGSNNLRPLIVGANAIFCQARGSIVRDLMFDWQVNGYRGNDLTIFSTHLFEGHQLVDWDYAQIPNYIIWAVRDDGVLLGLTYIHEQEVWGWHRHDFQNGFVENVLSIPEGQEDAVYVVVRRVINGRTVRYIERLNTRVIGDIKDFIGMDSTLSFDGRNKTAATMTLSGAGWTPDDDLTLTCSSPVFDSTYVGNQIFLTDAAGVLVRCTITAVTNANVATVNTDKNVPVDLQAVAVTLWAYAIQTISGLYHLEGQQISVVGDGLVVASPNNSGVAFTVTVTAGQAVLDACYSVIHAGIPVTNDAETLDMDVTQGETMADKQKLITQANVYVTQSRGIFAGDREPGSGPNNSTDPLDGLIEYKCRGEDAENYNDPVALKTDLIEVNVESSYTRNGRVFIRQVDAVPLTILAIAPAGFLPVGRGA